MMMMSSKVVVFMAPRSGWLVGGVLAKPPDPIESDFCDGDSTGEGAQSPRQWMD